MKKLILLTLALVLVLPMVFAVSIGTGIKPVINTEEFKPLVWLCDSRVVFDDATEPGRISNDGEEMLERINSYAFEGEQIQWRVLVMDKNGLNKLQDVFATIGSSQGAGNDIEVNCVPTTYLNQDDQIDPSCNARIQEERLNVVPSNNMMAYYTCTFTVETPESMYGKFWITVEALDQNGESGTMAENENWFLNPVIALSIDGDMSFDNVRPGTSSYSSTLLVGNSADEGSGVMMDMFISGTDFYDTESSGAMCPITNQLELENFRYFATNGAYSTKQDPRSDAEGYAPIFYGIGFNNPNPFYGNNEILEVQQVGPYYTANILAPGSEMALTFKLDLPEPCNGNFNSGNIYFFGEAI